MNLTNLKSKLSFFLNLCLLVFVFLLCSSFSYFLFKENSDRFYKTIDERLTIAVYSLKYILPIDYHERIKDKNSISREEYEKIKQTLNKLIRDIQIEYIYTMVKEDGKFYFTAGNTKTSDIINKIDPNFYEEYPTGENSELTKIDMKSGKIHAIYSNDKWGNFRTIVLPMQTKSGKEYIIGADINLSKIQTSINYFLGISILIGGSLFLPFAYITYDLLNKKRIYEYIFIQKRKTSIYLSFFITVIFYFFLFHLLLSK